MLILDTDHMSLLEWGAEESGILRERLADVAPLDVATTIISYEEQIRGWMAYVACEIDGATIASVPPTSAAPG
jgi:tRNA(fMet)-specific endonuclease VapC